MMIHPARFVRWNIAVRGHSRLGYQGEQDRRHFVDSFQQMLLACQRFGLLRFNATALQPHFKFLLAGTDRKFGRTDADFAIHSVLRPKRWFGKQQ